METKKLFIGGLPWALQTEDLQEIASEFGEVVFARVMTDRETGRSRGFGFVEYEDVDTATKAKEELDGAEIEGRTIRVDFAKEREQ